MSSSTAPLSDVLAAERTFLAWIRTGLSLMGFGFVVARFGLFLQEMQIIQRATIVPSNGLGLWFGTGLIAAGVAVYIISVRQYLQILGALDRGDALPRHRSAEAVSISVFLALIGIAMTVYLIYVHGPRL